MKYYTAAELVETLYRGLADNTVGKVIDTLLRHDLLICDLCRHCDYAEDRREDVALDGDSPWPIAA